MFNGAYSRLNAFGATRAWMRRKCRIPKCAGLSALAAKADTDGSVSPHVNRSLQGLNRETVVRGIHIAGSIDPVPRYCSMSDSALLDTLDRLPRVCMVFGVTDMSASAIRCISQSWYSCMLTMRHSQCTSKGPHMVVFLRLFWA